MHRVQKLPKGRSRLAGASYWVHSCRKHPPLWGGYSSRLSPATSSSGSDSSRRRVEGWYPVAPHLTPSTFPRVLAPRRPIPTPSPKVPTKASACNSLLNSPPLYVPTADAVINCRPLRSSWSPPPPPNAGPGATSWRITIKCFARIKSFVLRWED